MQSVIFVFATLWLAQSPQQSPRQDEIVEPAPRLQRQLDEAELSRCMGGMFGFRNVPLRCTSDHEGVLRQCELLTSNRAARRHSDRFACMAAATRVEYPDGTPAVGHTVQITLHGSSEFTEPSD